jgi:DNA-binding transcriptional MerR regulator
LTGISSDTLRMWERRYGFPKPQRNAAGIRVYSDPDIERLVLIARALKAGYRAGEVVERDAADLKRLLVAPAEPRAFTPTSSSLGALLDALRRDDVPALRAELRQSVATLGPRQFLVEVAGPLAERLTEDVALGRMEVRHERLASELLTTQLRLLLSAYEASSRGVTVIVTALERDRTEIPLEMVALYLAVSGCVPRLLGPELPADQIAEASRALAADVVYLHVGDAADADAISENVRWMLPRLLPDAEVWIGGRHGRAVQPELARAVHAASWDALDARIERLKRRA